MATWQPRALGARMELLLTRNPERAIYSPCDSGLNRRLSPAKAVHTCDVAC